MAATKDSAKSSEQQKNSLRSTSRWPQSQKSGDPKTAADATASEAQLAAQLGVTPPKTRRRPLLAVTGVILVVLGALVSAWAYNSLGNSVAVVAARVDIPRGTQLNRENLQIVRIGADPALQVVAADRLDSLIGQRAAFDVVAGSLVAERSVTREILPHKGKSIVGLSLTTGQLPGNSLQIADKVRLVAIATQATDTNLEKLKTVDGVVINVLPTDSAGKTTVNVEIAASAAPELAARAASGQVAVVLDSREQ